MINPLSGVDTRPDDGVDEVAPPPASSRRPLTVLAVASVVVAIAPIVVAVARAISRRWLPVGDNAFFEIRSRDVFTADHPLLGTWTSASQSLGVDLNNPGPLQFDLLAVPARFGRGSGLAVGVAMVNAAAVVGIALAARRLGGTRLVIAAMTMTAALGWTMGSQLLFDPWQPHILLFPLLCYLVLVWAIFAGDTVAVPWAAFVASFLVQTHLSFSVLAVALGGWALVGLGWRLRQQAHDDPARAAAIQRRALHVGVITTVVLVVSWAQPIIEQFIGEGKGNLGRIVSSVGNSSNSVGFVRGARVASALLVAPPWWARSSFGDSLLTPDGGPLGVGSPPEMAGLPGGEIAVLGMLLLVAALAAVAYLGYHRDDRLVATAAATAGAAVATAWATAALLPIGAFGIPAHQLRFLWPIGVFATFALAVAAVRLGHVWSSRAAPIAFVAVVAVFAVLNLPYNNNGAGATRDEATIPVMREINAQLAVLEGSGPLLFDVTGQRFAEPYTIAVQAELTRRGVQYVVADEVSVRQLGERRRFEGDAEAKILVRDGSAAFGEVPGASKVAFATGLDEDKREALAASRPTVVQCVSDGNVRLNERGRAAAERGDMPRLDDPRLDITKILDDRVLLLARFAGYIEVDDACAESFEQYASLQQEEDLLTVAVYLAPVTWTPEAP